MQLVRLSIHGFRGIREADIRFGRRTVLIGPNNSGKSTIIEAIALVFGRDKLVRDLTEHDFFGSDPQPADRIRIVATISDFLGDDPDRHPAWFRDDRAVEKWLNPITETLEAARTAQATKLACQIGFGARFDREELVVETIRYFHDSDDAGDVFDPDVVRRVPASVVRDIGFFLVPANRTWDRAISFGSELFRRVVSAIGGRPAQAVLTERDRLRRPDQPLENDEGLREIVANVNEELSSLLSRPPRLTLRLTATDSESVLDAVMPHFVGEGGAELPARRHGSGLISLQQLLLLLQFGRMRAERNEGFLLALEEPELHVPPPLQRRLTNRIQALSTQTIIATHSPVVAAGGEPTSLLILQNRGGVLSSQGLLEQPLNRDAPNWRRKVYSEKRQETLTALMHDIVLVPEGRTDFDILRLLVDAAELRRTDAGGDTPEFGTMVGVVPTPDARVQDVSGELGRIHSSVLCLVDGDAEGDRYARGLVGAARPPAKVLLWPQGWAIEDVIGWISEADGGCFALLTAALGTPVADAGALVAIMKRATADRGVKADVVAYESIIGILAESPACLARINQLLAALARGCNAPNAAPAAGWAREAISTAQTLVCRFAP